MGKQHRVVTKSTDLSQLAPVDLGRVINSYVLCFPNLLSEENKVLIIQQDFNEE